MKNLKEFVSHIARVNQTDFLLSDLVDEAEKQLMLEHKKPLVEMPLDAPHTALFTRALSFQMARNIKQELPKA